MRRAPNAAKRRQGQSSHSKNAAGGPPNASHRFASAEAAAGLKKTPAYRSTPIPNAQSRAHAARSRAWRALGASNTHTGPHSAQPKKTTAQTT